MVRTPVREGRLLRSVADMCSSPGAVAAGDVQLILCRVIATPQIMKITLSCNHGGGNIRSRDLI